MSDNEKELKLEDFLMTQGTLHHFSCVERPPQNSVVERKHQHILNVARALYFQEKLPLTFWGGCVTTVVHLINLTPTPTLKDHAPYTFFDNKLPTYHHLKVFGCLAYAS